MILSLEHNVLTTLEMNYLLEWTEIILSEDELFPDMECLAKYLTKWIKDYHIKARSFKPFTVTLYGDEVILIANRDTGEFIKLKNVPFEFPELKGGRQII